MLLVLVGQLFFGFDNFYIVGNLSGLAGVSLSLYLFKHRKTEASGHVLACAALSMVIMHNIIRDMFVYDPAMRYRIYINMVVLFGIYLIVISFFREKKMVRCYGLFFELIILAHSAVIYYKLRHLPVISGFVIQHTITAITGIAASGFISTWLLGYSDALFEQNKIDAERIKMQNETLEKLVDVRTKALSISNHNLQEFAYIVSHDLKEPLRTISGFITLLRKELNAQGIHGDKADEYMAYVLRGTHQMEELISDILTYSQLNVAERKFFDVPLSAVIDDVKYTLNKAIAESHAVITTDDMPIVTGDRRLLFQLFQNLISNALKYRKDNLSPVIRIQSVTVGSFVKISVSDNGIGIPEKYYETIFQAFKRLHSKVKYEGTGIGLVICKKIVDLHGGEIWVESKEGEGTTFSFALLLGEIKN